MRINIYTNQFQSAELFRKPVLYTEKQVQREVVPEGWHCYDLTGTDREPDKPVTLEDRMPWNRTGTVLSPVPLKRKNTLTRQIRNSFSLHEELLDLAGFCEKNHLPCPKDPRKYMLRPASHDEAGLFYSQKEEDAAQATVGHLRMDFGGGRLHHSWWPHNDDRFNTPEFKAVFQEFVDELRTLGPLQSEAAMHRWCYGYPEGEIGRDNVGFVAETEGGLIIEKYDSVTKQPLRGAQFKITTASGELVADNEGLTSTNGLYTTDINGQIVLSKLPPGTYVVAEEKAPDNYRKDPTPQTVVVNAADTQTLRFYDDPLCTLTILKRDAITKKPLAKAEFLVRDSEGRAVGPNNGRYITGTDGTVTVTGLEPNATIVVSETKAPTGYILDETPKNIVVRTGVANSLIFDNQPGTTLIIKKFIEGTENEPLSGVAFKVIDGSGAAVGPDDGIYYTDKAGEIVLSGIEPGTTVIAREIKTVEGFVLDGTPQTILIKGGEVQSLTFWNKRDCSLTIFKQSTGKEPLTGAVFHVTDEDGAAIGTNNGRYTTDRNGLITITGLQPGQILIVTEEKAPDGYVKDMTPKTIKIKQGVANSLIFENAHAGSLVINKYSALDRKTPLEGVTFKITTTSGEFLPDESGKISSNGLYYTDETGQIIINGIVGSLVVTEQDTIPGYAISDANRTQTVEVKPDDTQTLYFYNEPLCSLTITKLDSVSGKPVPNTEFTLKDGNGNVIGKYTTGKDGTVTVGGLVPGSAIVVTETRVPSGYVLNPIPQTIIVKNGTGNTLTSGAGSSSGGSGNTGWSSGNDLTFENDPKTTLTIEKYLETETGDKPLKGVTFLVTDSSGAVIGPNTGEYITGEDGRIVIQNLEPGTTITAREIKVPEGVLLDTAPKSIKIKIGEGQTLRFVNQRAGTLVIRKLDKVSKAPLAGTEFELTYAEGGFVDDANGHLSSKENNYWGKT